MKKKLSLIIILSSMFLFTSFSKNKTQTITGFIYSSGTDPLVFPVLECEDEKKYRIFTESQEDMQTFFNLQGKKIQIKGYIQEDEIYGLVIYPSSWKILKY